eukprot:9466439-Pyramimonas_sp.AAC.1
MNQTPKAMMQTQCRFTGAPPVLLLCATRSRIRPLTPYRKGPVGRSLAESQATAQVGDHHRFSDVSR